MRNEGIPTDEQISDELDAMVVLLNEYERVQGDFPDSDVLWETRIEPELKRVFSTDSRKKISERVTEIETFFRDNNLTEVSDYIRREWSNRETVVKEVGMALARERESAAQATLRERDHARGIADGSVIPFPGPKRK